MRLSVGYPVGTEGRFLGLARRSPASPTPGLITARGRLPARYSDLGRTTLKADVPEGGGRFDSALQSDPAAPAGPKP